MQDFLTPNNKAYRFYWRSRQANFTWFKHRRQRNPNDFFKNIWFEDKHESYEYSIIVSAYEVSAAGKRKNWQMRNLSELEILHSAPWWHNSRGDSRKKLCSSSRKNWTNWILLAVLANQVSIAGNKTYKLIIEHLVGCDWCRLVYWGRTCIQELWRVWRLSSLYFGKSNFICSFAKIRTIQFPLHGTKSNTWHSGNKILAERSWLTPW